jgi:hypothetical protein
MSAFCLDCIVALDVFDQDMCEGCMDEAGL